MESIGVLISSCITLGAIGGVVVVGGAARALFRSSRIKNIKMTNKEFHELTNKEISDFLNIKII